MKKISSIVILAMFTFCKLTHAQAPNCLWAKALSNNGGVYGYSLCTDVNGNVFLMGAFTGLFLTIGTTTLTNQGVNSIFIVKYDNNGNVIWVKGAGGATTQHGSKILTDQNGNLFLLGEFTSPTITFGTTTLTNAGNDDMFLVKYDTNGNVLWAKSYGGLNDDSGYGITSDSNGNTIVAGRFDSPTITFGTTILTNVNFGDAFLVKFDANGNELWAKSFNGNRDEQCHSVITDSNGNIILLGIFDGLTISFGAITLTNSGSLGIPEIFVVKFDAAGNEIWAKNPEGIGYDVGQNIAIDTNNNIVMTGYFSSPSISFGTTTLTNSGQYDIFTVKYDTNGNVIWAKSINGSADDAPSQCWVDANGQIILTGYFQSDTISADANILINADLLAPHARDIFIINYDANGNVIWSKSAGGTGADLASAIVRDVYGNIFLAGNFRSPVITFGTINLNNVDTLTYSPYAFITKFESEDVGVIEKDKSDNILIAPNPFTNQTMVTFKEEQKNARLSIIDILGHEIKTLNFSGRQIELNKDDIPAGFYFIKTIDENKSMLIKQIVIQ
jgi:hypothetical protein